MGNEAEGNSTNQVVANGLQAALTKCLDIVKNTPLPTETEFMESLFPKNEGSLGSEQPQMIKSSVKYLWLFYNKKEESKVRAIDEKVLQTAALLGSAPAA